MKTKTHWFAVKVKLDKPASKSQALKIAQDCFKGTDQFHPFYGDGPEQIWLSAFSSKMPSKRGQK